MKTKICSRCKKEKKYSEFYKNKTRKDGKTTYCKKCIKKEREEYYQKNKEKIKRRVRKYQIKNTEKLRERNRKYRQKNRNWVRKYNQKYYARDNPIKTWCWGTIKSHKQKEYIVKFKMKDLLPIAQKTKYCNICGDKLFWGFKNGKLLDNSPSLDRINNNKILDLNNIQILCHNCNATKRSRTMKEFINYCEMVYKKFKEN